MSTTCGPIVPGRIGKMMSGEPSLKLKVAFLSVMTSISQRHSLSGCATTQIAPHGSSRGSQTLDQRHHRRVGWLLAARQHFPQIVIVQLQNRFQRCKLGVGDLIAATVEKARQDK